MQIRSHFGSNILAQEVLFKHFTVQGNSICMKILGILLAVHLSMAPKAFLDGRRVWETHPDPKPDTAESSSARWIKPRA
jgi:hypothetical protein